MRRAMTSWRATVALGAMLSTAVACGPPPAQEAPVETVVWPVLLVRFGPDLAVPLGCYDPDTRMLAGTRTCAQRVPAGGEVSVDGAGGFEVVGAMQAVCASRGGGRNAVQLRHADGAPMASVEPGVPVVWPAEAASRTLERHAVPSAPVEVDAALGAAIDKMVGALYPPEHWFIRQVVEVDLDGDGASDHLISVASGEPGAETWGVLAVAWAGGEPGFVHTSNKAWFGVEATTDLDADGTREIWFHARAGDSFDNVLTVLDGREAREIGAWGCE